MLGGWLRYGWVDMQVITNVVSVDYLSRPIEVFKEMHRVSQWSVQDDTPCTCISFCCTDGADRGKCGCPGVEARRCSHQLFLEPVFPHERCGKFFWPVALLLLVKDVLVLRMLRECIMTQRLDTTLTMPDYSLHSQPA